MYYHLDCNSTKYGNSLPYGLLFIGMHCKADFYSQTHEGGDYSPENLVLDEAGEGGAGGERRRSERGRKREKPDYYDSLEFEK